MSTKTVGLVFAGVILVSALAASKSHAQFRDRSGPVRIAEHGTVIPAESDYPESSGSPSSLLNRSFRFQLHYRARPYDRGPFASTSDRLGRLSGKHGSFRYLARRRHSHRPEHPLFMREAVCGPWLHPCMQRLFAESSIGLPVPVSSTRRRFCVAKRKSVAGYFGRGRLLRIEVTCPKHRMTRRSISAQ